MTKNNITKIPSLLALLLIYIYRHTFAIFLGGQCRFFPSCSNYAFEAFKRHRFFYALKISLKRIFHCHPFNSGGYDPVP